MNITNPSPASALTAPMVALFPPADVSETTPPVTAGKGRVMLRESGDPYPLIVLARTCGINTVDLRICNHDTIIANLKFINTTISEFGYEFLVWQ